MPTWLNTSSVRARAAAPVSPRCSNEISPICFSIVCSGLSDVIGSWNTIVMSSPRTRRISRSESGSRLRSLNVTLPDGWCAAGYGKSLRIDSAVADLPEPGSPTNATVSPLPMSNDTRSTASVWRSPKPKATERSRMERRGEVMKSAGQVRRYPLRLAQNRGFRQAVLDQYLPRETRRSGFEWLSQHEWHREA